MSQWIWKFGEFEIYHNMILHQRRQQYGFTEPVVWKIYAPEPVVRFKKTVNTQGGLLRVTACGDSSITVIDEQNSVREGAHYTGVQKYGGKKEIELQSGKYTIEIRVSNSETFPCVYVEGMIESDETWLADYTRNHSATPGVPARFTCWAAIAWVYKIRESPMILLKYGRSWGI